jgi:diguanylate cyclase (GGDEF)-like protein/PAS domain S-box-containing protein
MYRINRYPAIYSTISTLLVLVAMSVAAWQANRHMHEDREVPLIKALGNYAATLDEGTVNSRAMGAAILFGLQNREAKRLALGQLPPDVPEVASSLDTLRKLYFADSVFVVNKLGVIVAYSGKDHIHGTGEDVAFRPYVQLAMLGTPNVYPAVGIINTDRGIFLAAPLRATMSNTSEAIGVIAVKVGVDKLDELLRTWTGGIAVLLSPQGMVFAASRNDWLFRVAGEVTSKRLADIRRARQFGKTFDLASPVSLPFTLATPDATIEGVHYAVRSLALDWNDPAGDWMLAFLEKRAPWWSNWSVLGIALLAGLVSALALFWFYALARNAQLLKNMNIQLRHNEEMLKESQIIAGLGTYTLVIPTMTWESSEVLDKLFGIKKSYVRSLDSWFSLIHPEDRKMMESYFSDEILGQGKLFDKEYRITRYQDLAVRWVHGFGKVEFDAQGHPLKLYGTIQDITERKESEAEIHSLAFFDPLTKLPNRRHLLDRIHQAQSVSARSNLYGALLFLDMDKFKSLNDTLGHDIGDLFLVEVARRMLLCVRDVDTVARIGGDEFVVLTGEIGANAEEVSQKVALIAEKIRAALSEPYKLKAYEHHSSPSIGVCLFRGNETSMDSLLKQADMAMYQAKGSGRNAVRFYDPAMQLAVETHAALESDMRHAITDKQFHLYYQVQIDNQHRAVGAEALIRWEHPERGLVSPLQFIPIAEESSLILDIGRWVLETACRQLALWGKREYTCHLILAVNVSAVQFKKHNFVDIVTTLVHIHQIDPSRLKLELTEAVVLEDVADVVTKMHALKALGVQLSLDDFGTGYSSLSYLKQLPLDQIKIDQSFVRDAATDVNDAVMVKTIIDLAKNFRLNVIAEGVETAAQLHLLKQDGCLLYQGYLFSKPVPIGEFEKLLSQYNKPDLFSYPA